MSPLSPLGIYGFAGGAAGAFESIASATGTGSSGTITFSSIPSTYQSLHIRGIVRTDNSAAAGNLLLRFNSDSGSNYPYHYLGGDGATTIAFGSAATTSGFAIFTSANASFNSNVVGSTIIDIHDYASTSRNKTVRAFSGVDNNSASVVGKLALSSSLWMNTSAITSISIIASSSANFTTATQFALYGIKGA